MPHQAAPACACMHDTHLRRLGLGSTLPAPCMRAWGLTSCSRRPPAQAGHASWDASDAVPSGRSSAAGQQLVAAVAAAVTRFEAEVAPCVAAEAQPEAGLEDLRLRTPTLRPVGCWCTGCGAPRHAACWQEPAVTHAPARERAGRAQVRRPVRRVGGGPADAAVLRLQRRALLLGRVPEDGLARRPQGRVPAPASARLTGAAAQPPTLLRRMQARALLGAAHVDMRQRAAAQRRAQRGSSAQAGLSARSPRAARWDRRISRLLLVAGTVTLVAVRRTGACELAPARPTLLLAPAAVSARDAGARWRLFYGERPGQVPCTGGALHLQSARAGDTW